MCGFFAALVAAHSQARSIPPSTVRVKGKKPQPATFLQGALLRHFRLRALLHRIGITLVYNDPRAMIYTGCYDVLVNKFGMVVFRAGGLGWQLKWQEPVWSDSRHEEGRA